MADFGGIPPATGKADLGQPGWYGLASFLNNFGQAYAKRREFETEMAFKMLQQQRQERSEAANIEIGKMTPEYRLVPEETTTLTQEQKTQMEPQYMAAGMNEPFGATERVIMPKELSETEVPAGKAVSELAGKPSKWRLAPPKSTGSTVNYMSNYRLFSDEWNSTVQSLRTDSAEYRAAMSLPRIPIEKLDEVTNASAAEGKIPNTMASWLTKFDKPAEDRVQIGANFYSVEEIAKVQNLAQMQKDIKTSRKLAIGEIQSVAKKKVEEKKLSKEAVDDIRAAKIAISQGRDKATIIKMLKDTYGDFNWDNLLNQ